MFRRPLFLSILCLASLPAFAGPTEDALAHSKKFEAAVNQRDAAAVLALYSKDARVVWPGQGEEAHGTAEIEKLIANFMKGFPKDGKLEMKSQVAIPLDGGYFATVGQWQESFTGSDGKKQTVDVRTTEIIRKHKGSTLYIVDHASVGLPPP